MLNRVPNAPQLIGKLQGLQSHFNHNYYHNVLDSMRKPDTPEKKVYTSDIGCLTMLNFIPSCHILLKSGGVFLFSIIPLLNTLVNTHLRSIFGPTK